MKKIIMIILLANFMNAFAEEAFISQVNFGGSGCSQDEAMAVLSPDQHVLSLLFDNFVVEAGGEAKKRERKNCNIKLNIAVPENKRIVINKIDYRGYALLPEIAKMRFVSSYQIQIPELGFNGPEKKDRIVKLGEFDDDLYMEQKVRNRITQRACGRDIILNINTRLAVITNEAGDEVYASIDSLDSGIDYHLEYEECTPQMRRSPEERSRRRMLRERFRRQNDQNLERRQERRERRMRRGRPHRGNRGDRMCRGRGCGRRMMEENARGPGRVRRGVPNRHHETTRPHPSGRRGRHHPRIP